MRRPSSLLCSWIGVVALGWLLLPSTQAFAPPFGGALLRSANHVKWGLYSASEEYSEAEVLDMKELIRSLSMEPTDHDRRTRVKEIFHEALGRPNGSPKRFTDLFDKILIQFGDEVQNEAKKKYFEEERVARDEEERAPLVTGDNERSDNVDVQPEKREKTPEELQLWALVDMMVQTKTIVKKNSGELGSKGTFQ